MYGEPSSPSRQRLGPRVPALVVTLGSVTAWSITALAASESPAFHTLDTGTDAGKAAQVAPPAYLNAADAGASAPADAGTDAAEATSDAGAGRPADVRATGAAPTPKPVPVTGLPLCETAESNSGPCEIPSFTTIVTAKRPPPVGTTSRIDATEIALRGARNIAEALEGEPSVEVNQGPKAGATLQVRGFDERAVLLMIEGIPIREVYDGHFDIASLPAFSLGTINMERGVTSLLYGPNTAGAILSLWTPSACNETVDLSGYGRPETEHRLLYGGRLKACRRFGDVSVFASAGYEHSDGYVLSHDYVQNANNAQFHEQGGVRDGSDYDRSTVALLAKYAPRKNKSLSLFLNGVHSPRGIPPFEGYGYTRYWRFTTYDTLLAGLSGVYGPEPGRLPATWGFQEVRGQVYAHVHRDEIRDYQDVTYSRLTTNPLAWFVASAYANETYGAMVQSSWTLNTGNRLDVSLRYNLDRHAQRTIPVPRNGLATDWTQWDHYSSHTFTVATEDTQVLGSWRFNAGIGFSGMSLLAQEIRNTSYPVDHRVIPAFEGRVVVERSLGDHIRVMAAGGHKVRFPMLKELFSNSIGGNPDLRTEQAWMTEAGFDTNGFLTDRLDTSLRLYWNSIRDLIESYRQAYANIGRAVTAGVEVEVRYKPAEALQFFSGYRYLYAHDLEHDRPLDYRTPHRVLAGARVFTRFRLTGALDAAYNSGQEGYYVDPATGDWVEDRLPGYVLANAHLRYALGVAAHGELYLFADGFNLFDTNYAIGSFEPRPGREVIVGLGGRY
jgi:outer membrane cobalamin receptor